MGHIAIGSLGGTIAMVPDEPGQGAIPKLTAQNLLASIPGLPSGLEIRAESIRQLPSASLTFEDTVIVLQWAREQVAAGAAGIVITQGTDTLEEVAFLLDLLWDQDAPLIITGAMRTANAVGADGPSNLFGAIQTAAADASRGRGVMVVMNDTIHAARFVVKSHAMNVAAFTSAPENPLGAIIEGTPFYFSPPASRRVLAQPMRTDHNVALIESTLGGGCAMIDWAAQSGAYQGIVIAAFGVGHVSEKEADAVARHAGVLPILVASRTGGGTTARRTYGYKGAEIDLIKRGALMAGWLSARKARILLWSFLATAQPLDQLGTEIGYWGHFTG